MRTFGCTLAIAAGACSAMAVEVRKWSEGSELVDRVVLIEVRQAKLGMDY